MNNTIWKLLAGLGLGASAVPDEAEAALIPSRLLTSIPSKQMSLGDRMDRVGKRIIDKYEKKYASEFNRPRTPGTLFKYMEVPENERLYKMTGGKIFLDDSGNMRYVTKDDFTTDAANILKSIPKDVSLPLEEILNKEGLLSRVLNDRYGGIADITAKAPEVGANAGIKYTPDNLNISLYGPENRTNLGLLGSTAHETQHGIDAVAGLDYGANPNQFVENKYYPKEFFYNSKDPVSLYSHDIGEQLARANTAMIQYGYDPFKYLQNQRWSWNPSEAIEQYSGQPVWQTTTYGDAWPHKQSVIRKLIGENPSAADRWVTAKENYQKGRKTVWDDTLESAPSLASLALGLLPGAVPQIASSLFDALDYAVNPPENYNEQVARQIPNMSITAQAALEDPYIMSLFTGY